MSVKEERLSDTDDEVYSVLIINRDPLSMDSDGQCSYSIKKESLTDCEDNAASIHDGYEYNIEIECVKQEEHSETEESATVAKTEQIVDDRHRPFSVHNIDVPVKIEIDIDPTMMQQEYSGSSLHTTDASKAELIQCGGADVALGTTTPGAAPYRTHSSLNTSVVRGGTSDKIMKKDKGILKRNKPSTLVNEKPFFCDICQYNCKFKSQLVTHKLIHTGEKPFSCTICEYKSAHKTAVVKHIRTHTGNKPFSCNICEYKCTVKSRLVEHMRTHTGEKPFACNACEYKCADKSSLRRHIRVHTGDKPYSCNICEHKCSVKSSLAIHMFTHSKEKPFTCNICEFKCVIKSRLVEHMRTHTEENPFSCNICEYKTAQKSALVKHMIMHSKEMFVDRNV